MGLDRAIATVCQKVHVVFSLDLNDPNVLIELRPGFNELQTKGTETGKAAMWK